MPPLNNSINNDHSTSVLRSQQPSLKCRKLEVAAIITILALAALGAGLMITHSLPPIAAYCAFGASGLVLVSEVVFRVILAYLYHNAKQSPLPQNAEPAPLHHVDVPPPPSQEEFLTPEDIELKLTENIRHAIETTEDRELSKDERCKLIKGLDKSIEKIWHRALDEDYSAAGISSGYVLARIPRSTDDGKLIVSSGMSVAGLLKSRAKEPERFCISRIAAIGDRNLSVSKQERKSNSRAGELDPDNKLINLHSRFWFEDRFSTDAPLDTTEIYKQLQKPLHKEDSGPDSSLKKRSGRQVGGDLMVFETDRDVFIRSVGGPKAYLVKPKEHFQVSNNSARTYGSDDSEPKPTITRIPKQDLTEATVSCDEGNFIVLANVFLLEILDGKKLAVAVRHLAASGISAAKMTECILSYAKTTPEWTDEKSLLLQIIPFKGNTLREMQQCVDSSRSIRSPAEKIKDAKYVYFNARDYVNAKLLNKSTPREEIPALERAKEELKKLKKSIREASERFEEVQSREDLEKRKKLADQATEASVKAQKILESVSSHIGGFDDSSSDESSR